MLTRLILACVLALALPGWAGAATGSSAVDTWYVRPLGACANNGDGLAYGCASGAGATGAFIGRANIIWTATTGVDDGDTLYICGSHTESIFPGPNTIGTASSRIKINWSCPSDRGSIRISTIMTEGLVGGNWTNESGNLWYLSLAAYAALPNPRRVWLSGTEEFPATVKADLGTREGGGSNPISRWWYDSGNARLYIYATANPATVYSSFESLVATSSANCGYTPFCIPSSTRQYIDLINPILEGGNTVGLYINDASTEIRVYGTDVSECQIGNRSPQGISFNDAASNGTGATPTYIRVHDCTIDSGIPSALYVYGSSQGSSGLSWDFGGWGDGIHFRYACTNCVIEDNIVRNWPHAQIYIHATAGTNTITGNHIRNNYLDCDLSYCHGLGSDGTSLGMATNNWWYGNQIWNMATHDSLNGNGNYFIGNLWANHRCETVSTLNRCATIHWEGYTASVSQDNYFVNNTLANNEYAPCIEFVQGLNNKSGFVVANNILLNCGGTNVAGKENYSLYIQNHASVLNQTFKNNEIYDSSVTNTVYYKATGATTVAGFQAACSGDTCSGNIATNPLLMTATTDFSLRSGSPARRTGSTGYPCYDVRHPFMQCWSPPDIGAFQAHGGARDQAVNRTAR